MAKKKTEKKLSKAAFVRSIDAGTPAKEVVAKAKAEGMVLSEAYVYNVRATSKSKKGGGRGRPGRPATKTGPSARVSHGRGGAEELLRAVAAELGLAHAISILEAEHSRVRRLIGNA
ncbi:MAG TPA: hypothetical protein VF407_18305 [Polyangiaceae bacterium]